MLTYDGMRGSVRPVQAARQPRCIVCSSEGALGRGTGWALPKPGQ
jgi:molybdopterin-synthase adenylyltransferase